MDMLDKKVVELLNAQITKEFYSGYLYLDFANYYTENGLVGFANWYQVQAQEERDHAMLFMQYLLNNGERVALQDIKAPKVAFKDFRTPIEAAFEHEKVVTASINDIYAKAYEIKDFRTMQFLDWFIKEQAEEEKNTEDVLKRYDLFGSDAKSLYLFDTELATRTYAAATLTL